MGVNCVIILIISFSLYVIGKNHMFRLASYFSHKKSINNLSFQYCHKIHSPSEVPALSICSLDFDLAKSLNIPYYSNTNDNFTLFVGYIFQYNAIDPNILEIKKYNCHKKVKEIPFYIDFLSGKHHKRRMYPQDELISKSLGKAPIIIDMTAGLGRDSQIIASLGKQVLMIERNPFIHALLTNALERLAKQEPDFTSKLKLLFLDSGLSTTNILSQIQKIPNISSLAISVYLDPMYPEDPNERKALVKKETQYLHALVPLLTPEEEIKDRTMLFESAKKIATDRIIVKRGLHSPFLLPELEPHSVIKGSTQRFDIYFKNQLN